MLLGNKSPFNGHIKVFQAVYDSASMPLHSIVVCLNCLQ